MRTILEYGVMNNAYGYLTLSDVYYWLAHIHSQLLIIDLLNFNHLTPIEYENMSRMVSIFTQKCGYDWSHIEPIQQFHMYKIHLLIQKNQLLDNHSQIAQMALQNNPFRTR
jgi:regulation of enolase protein 1 (concanavalin A-like superfamily)